MRLKLTLLPNKQNQRLTFNYNHPFASWVYSRIQESDAKYADFLHQRGYEVENSNKRFKHFTFSKFEIPNKAKSIQKGDDFILLSDKPIYITVSFYIDKAAEDFIIGLFKDQHISIFDRKYQADFIITGVESLPVQLETQQNIIVLKAASPMVIAEKRSDGSDEYLNPADERFAQYFALNLLSKYESVFGKSLTMDATIASKLINFRLIDTEKMRGKLIAIKQHKEDQTRVRGYENFIFELSAPQKLIEVGYFGGFGKNCSAAGMGYCETI